MIGVIVIDCRRFMCSFYDRGVYKTLGNYQKVFKASSVEQCVELAETWAFGLGLLLVEVYELVWEIDL